MTTTAFTPPLAPPIPGGPKKKRVLLVDTSTAKRELRAEVMRKMGMDVDCAADISEARSWWRADLYDLVLINVDKGAGHRDKFCDDIRSATPSQHLAFLVGKPEYLANVPGLDGEVPLPVHLRCSPYRRCEGRTFHRPRGFIPALGNYGSLA